MKESQAIGVSMTPQIVMPLDKGPDGTNVGQLFLIGHGTLLVYADGSKSKVENAFSGVVYRRVESSEAYNMKITIMGPDCVSCTAFFSVLPLVTGQGIVK